MAKTIELEAYPNTTLAYAVSRGGTGTPAANYAMTPIGGSGSWEYEITVAENLVGEWSFRCGDAQGNKGMRAVELFSAVDSYPISKSGGSEITVSIQGTNTTES
jgi:hypothetical protein